MTDQPQESSLAGAPYPEGRNPLFRAIECFPEDVPALIRAGADVNGREGFGSRGTPLLFAVDLLARGSVYEEPAAHATRGAVEALLDAGADVEATDTNGHYPLEVAVNGPPWIQPLMPEIVSLLLAHGADPNGLYPSEISPLDSAYRAANGGIVRVLWSAGARLVKTVKKEADPLHRDEAELSRAADLSLSALRGDTAAVDRLLEQGVDVNALDIDGRTALHKAARNGDAVMVAHLLARGADVHARDDLAMSHGSPIRGGIGLPDADAENWAVYPQKGEMPLHGAAEEGHPEVVRLLLAHGADVHAFNVTDATGATPLVLAIRWSPWNQEGVVECVRVLLDAGYGPGASSSAEQAERARLGLADALGNAAWGGDVDLIPPLLEYGAGERREDILYAIKRATTDNGVNSLPILWEAGQRLSPPLTLIETLPFLSGIWEPEAWSMASSFRWLFESYRDIDVTVPNPANGETPLLWLVRNVGATVEYPYGGDYAHLYREDDFPERWARQFEDSVIDQLLLRGADPNAQDHTGESPLSVARAREYFRLTARLERAVSHQ